MRQEKTVPSFATDMTWIDKEVEFFVHREHSTVRSIKLRTPLSEVTFLSPERVSPAIAERIADLLNEAVRQELRNLVTELCGEPTTGEPTKKKKEVA